MLSAAAYTMGWDSRKDLFGGGNSRERDYVCEGSWGASVTSKDSVHDGMETADIGVVTGSQPWKRKAAVGQDDPGIECAYVPIVQTA